MRLHTVPTVFDRWLAGPLPTGSQAGSTSPRLDLVEHADRFEIAVDLPGFRREDVEVEFAAGTLELRGERSSDERVEGARVHVAERRSLRFRRGFRLGESIEVLAIEAKVKDGVLRVTLPKSAHARPREIEVTEAS